MSILAFDEGAWHPSGWIITLWPLSIFLSLIPVIQLARGGARRWDHYAVLALPFVVLFGVMAYIGYGKSGDYTGHGTIGPGAHVDVVASLVHAATLYPFVCVPTLIAAALAHWTFLRSRLPLLFWSPIVLLVVVQVLWALIVWVFLMDDAAIR